jgi:myo-inositol-1(or 4)-monophosphatase
MPRPSSFSPATGSGCGVLDPSELEQIAAAVARAAAVIVTDGHRRPVAVGSKASPTDVVTETDLNAEDLIRRLLHDATPEAGTLGEEGGVTLPGARLQWVIDPLDGTVNFLHGVPIFAVSIAAAVDGEVVAGAVLDVLRDELFSAHLGGGACRDDEAIAVSGCLSLAEALVATGFSHRAGERLREADVAHRLLARAGDLRCFGSAALELCWAASGRVDAYYQRHTESWDRAAGALIAAEAGATVELPCPENGDLVIVAEPAIFDELRAIVQVG